MKIAVSDLADRYSILLLKSNRAKIDVSEEFNQIQEELKNYPGVMNFVARLYDVNSFIWDLESDIRSGKEEKLGLEEVGKRALRIRDFNKKRIEIKNEIVEEYKEGFKEVKKNHGSE